VSVRILKQNVFSVECVGHRTNGFVLVRILNC